MANFEILGGKELSGEIKVAGSKNAALPLICATLLTSETCKLSNVPQITDIEILLEMIEQLGAKVKRSGDTLEINASAVKPKVVKPEFFTKLRASILLLGPLVGRFNTARLNYPGGCVIGRRPIDTHLEAVKELGGVVTEKDESFEIELEHLKDSNIYLRESSVTATENILMLVAAKSAQTIIDNAASEPHVTSLAEALKQMGAEIKGIGSNRLMVKGTDNLGGFDIRVNCDEIEAGTFIALGAAAQAPLKITNIEPMFLKPILSQIDLMNIKYDLGKDYLELKPPFNIKPVNVRTQPWPGFPTDLQPPFTVLATQVKGKTLIHETMYDQRLFYTDQLLNMGADITLCDPHRIVVNGPDELMGARIASPDIRAGIALVMAALVAKGKSVIGNIELIDRGYENIEERLKGIGAQIKRIE